MNDKRLSFPEAVKYFGKALKVSIRARGVASLVLSLIGFAVAFLPVLISLAVRRFSDAVQQLYGQGEAAVVSVLGIFIILSALYIVQLIWGSLSSYFEQRDQYKIQMFMEERVLRGELTALTREAVDSLGEPDGEIFRRHYFLYQKTGEIADELGLNAATVRTKLARGRDRLRSYFTERGYTCADPNL